MFNRQLPLLAVALSAAALTAAQLESHKAGSFEDGGDTQVSAMMMFLGNTEKVYILDKSEGNAAKFGDFPAMGAVYDIASRKAETMAVSTNVFCASGMHLPNGSFATFGGNGAIGKGGNVSDITYPGQQYAGLYDTVYGDYDGTKAIRILNPCKDGDDFSSPNCQWFDNASLLSMQSQRWYSAAEPMGDGTVVLIGGFTNGGYINRNYPNVDPATEGGAANPTYEFFPANGRQQQTMQFMIKTSGLNAYALTYLMKSGKMLVQANYSTILWDPLTNEETDLPDMPGQIVRVYPASGANAMLPLLPENNYTQTVIFCGGIYLPDDQWGNYSWPFADTWAIAASKKCHTITPEPEDGSAVEYVEDDDLPVSRTMGQFIALPDLTMLVVNGGANGTAGYSTRTLNTLELPFGMSLASEPVGQPAIYDPSKPKGQRWSTAGFDTSSIARLYHSSAILLPDASVLIAGSNPNVDVNLTAPFPTTYKAEVFYPSYFAAATRPSFTGAPSTLSYGGDPFDLKVSADSYSGSANDAADNTTVVLIRPGWTTHAMNMGQRSMKLNNTYTVNQDGTITLHVSQLPPNPNLFQPGPALLFVTMSGIPSNGSYVIVGSGNIETQPTQAASVLPASQRLSGVTGSGSSSSSSSSGKNDNTNGATSHTGAIVGGIIAAIAAVGILGAGFGIWMARRRRAAAQQASSLSYPMGTAPGGAGGVASSARAGGPGGLRSSDSSAFVPLSQANGSTTWGANASSLSLNSPYYDDPRTASGEFDPYHQNAPRMSTNQARGPY
ncbi:copper radical oxidase [Trametes coccinea BRFM310]|uniref:Copper radical oxidase n=1 Tax=Trametes coccinea (strain BRFM310) TaxID=1353009 RepID=A0A1Y2J2T7_TRAC3|nr:copper radical oxidase [Trametes coccinea BRFM310]